MRTILIVLLVISSTVFSESVSDELSIIKKQLKKTFTVDTKEQITKIGNFARKKAEAKYSLERMVPTFETLYAV